MINPPKIQVLLVDDNPIDAALTRRLLQALGKELPVETQWVDDAAKAFQAVQRRPYDLVLLDYQLPGASGLDVLTELQKLPPGQRPAVIMLTASGNEHIAVETMKRGARDYIRKDELAVTSLTRAVLSALSQKRLQDQVDNYLAQTQAELQMARQLQHAMLPQRFPTFPNTAPPADSALRFYARYIATTELGGDFYNVVPISATAAGVFICDVMGHGVRAALVTAMLRALVEELRPVAHEPGQFLQGLNQGLHAILQNAAEPLFATAFYLVADAAQGTLQFANAGHPPPLHLQRQAGTVMPLSLGASRPGPALGLFADTTYATGNVEWIPRDMVLLFTDGLFEVIGRDGQELGQPWLLAAVQKHQQLPGLQLINDLISMAQHHAGAGKFADDVCLLGVELARRTGSQGAP